MEPMTFQWGSKLGASVVLFLMYGGSYVLIAFLGTLFYFFKVLPDPDRIFLMSDRADVAYYGEPPRELMARVPEMRVLRNQGGLAMTAFMGAAGVLILSVAWFGLKAGQAWALWTLVAAGVVVLPFWALLFAPYVRAGIAEIWLGHPPFMSVPLLLLLPAAVLGYLGLR